MREIITWLKETFPYPVYDTEATHSGTLQDYPYFLVIGDTETRSQESNFNTRHWSEAIQEITIRCVGADAEGARVLRDTLRVRLPRMILTQKLKIEIEWVEARPVVADTSAAINGVQTHPVFIDEVFELWIQQV